MDNTLKIQFRLSCINCKHRDMAVDETRVSTDLCTAVTYTTIKCAHQEVCGMYENSTDLHLVADAEDL